MVISRGRRLLELEIDEGQIAIVFRGRYDAAYIKKCVPLLGGRIATALPLGGIGHDIDR